MEKEMKFNCTEIGITITRKDEKFSKDILIDDEVGIEAALTEIPIMIKRCLRDRFGFKQ